MPFIPRLLTMPMPDREPDVRIFFHGQLLLRSKDGMTCEVGVNPIATNHVLSVEARMKKSVGGMSKAYQDKAEVIYMRHVGPLHFRQPEGMTIEVIPPADTLAAWKCITLDPIDYEKGEGPLDEDFRWMLNLEGDLFHKTELDPVIFGTQHVIKLQGGEFFFYTAMRAGEGLKFVRTSRTDGDEMTFRKIGAIAVAKVFLVENQSVVLRWHDGNEEQVLTFTKSLQGETYDICIENTPLYEQVSPMSDLSERDELNQYYKVIPTVSEDARFNFIPVRETSPEGEAGSPDVPCQAMILDGPDS